MNNQEKHSKFSVSTRLLAIERVLEEGWRVSHLARAIGASRQIIYRWLRRFKLEGEAGVHDRSSRPKTSPRQLPAETVAAIQAKRLEGLSLGQLAQELEKLPATIWRWLKKLGLNRRPRPAREPVQRYEAAVPGELVHMDIKKLRSFDWAGRKFIEVGGRRQRGASQQYLHVCIDSYSRVAFAQVLERENGLTCMQFVRAAKEFFAGLGVSIQRILTDNGSAYRGKLMARQLSELGIVHSFTRVRRPQTNGKAERFIRTAMDEWGYRRYENSQLRDAALPSWLQRYNHMRNHSAIGHRPPISRLQLSTTS
jgi:transposase InsO family protein